MASIWLGFQAIWLSVGLGSGQDIGANKLDLTIGSCGHGTVSDCKIIETLTPLQWDG
jgi:hypothetical protein